MHENVRFFVINVSLIVVFQEGAQWSLAPWSGVSSRKEMMLNLWATIAALSLWLQVIQCTKTEPIQKYNSWNKFPLWDNPKK